MCVGWQASSGQQVPTNHSLTITQTHTNTRTHTHSLPLSLSHTHTEYTHTHKHTHTYTHTHSTPFSWQAFALAVLSAAAVVVSRVGQRSVKQVGLSERWAGWLQRELEAPFDGPVPTKMQASMVPTGAMNLAAMKKPLAVAQGSQLKAWVATGVENFARACGKDRDEPCPTGQSSTANGGVAKRAVENGNQVCVV